MFLLNRRSDWRHQLYLKGSVGEDSLVDELLAAKETKTPTPTSLLFQTTQFIRSRDLHRMYMEAGLLAITSEDQFPYLAEILDLQVEVVAMYRDMYFDISFTNKLQKLDLADVEDKEEATLRLWSISQGLDFLAWRLGKKTDLSPIDGLKDLFSTCFYKSKEALFNANASVASRESAKWVKLSIEVGKLLKTWVMDSSAAKQDLEIAIREVIPEFESVEDLEGFDSASVLASLTAIEDTQTLNKDSD